MKFLEFPYTEDDLQCTIKSTIQGFHRKHKNVTDPYTPELRKFVMAQIRLANKILHSYNISYWYEYYTKILYNILYAYVYEFYVYGMHALHLMLF